MQSRRAHGEQAFAQPGDHFLAESFDRSVIILDVVELAVQPAGDIGATGVGEAHQIGHVEDRHDARVDRGVAADFLQRVQVITVGIRVVEILGQAAVGAGVDLALEVGNIIFKAARLGVHLRVGGHFQCEVTAGFLTDQLHQFVRILDLTLGVAHAGGQVAAQGHDAGHSRGLVAVHQLQDFLAALADAAQVRGGVAVLIA